MKLFLKIPLSLLIALLAIGATWLPALTTLPAWLATPAPAQPVVQPATPAALQPPTATAQVEISPQPGLKEPKIFTTVQPTKPPGDLSRTDSQGAVTVVVTPLNLGNPGNTLQFEVRMDSVTLNLGMNLAKLATLTTDNGLEVSASAWQPDGVGRHVTGRLSFPSNMNGSPLLGYARVLTLALRHVDVPLRTFTWELSKA